MSPIHDDLNLSRAQRIKRALIHAFKRTVTFLFSHIGLTSVVVGYVIFGGILFMAIEAPNEMKIREKAVKHQEETLEDLEKLINEMIARDRTHEEMIQTIVNTVLAGPNENMTNADDTIERNTLSEERVSTSASSSDKSDTHGDATVENTTLSEEPIATFSSSSHENVTHISADLQTVTLIEASASTTTTSFNDLEILSTTAETLNSTTDTPNGRSSETSQTDITHASSNFTDASHSDFNVSNAVGKGLTTTKGSSARQVSFSDSDRTKTSVPYSPVGTSFSKSASDSRNSKASVNVPASYIPDKKAITLSEKLLEHLQKLEEHMEAQKIPRVKLSDKQNYKSNILDDAQHVSEDAFQNPQTMNAFYSKQTIVGPISAAVDPRTAVPRGPTAAEVGPTTSAHWVELRGSDNDTSVDVSPQNMTYFTSAEVKNQPERHTREIAAKDKVSSQRLQKVDLSGGSSTKISSSLDDSSQKVQQFQRQNASRTHKQKDSAQNKLRSSRQNTNEKQKQHTSQNKQPPRQQTATQSQTLDKLALPERQQGKGDTTLSEEKLANMQGKNGTLTEQDKGENVTQIEKPAQDNAGTQKENNKHAKDNKKDIEQRQGNGKGNKTAKENDSEKSKDNGQDKARHDGQGQDKTQGMGSGQESDTVQGNNKDRNKDDEQTKEIKPDSNGKESRKENGEQKRQQREEEREFKKNISKLLKKFESKAWILSSVHSWDGMQPDDGEMQWSFAGAMLYSVTVVTTIGYGHLAPKTVLGRMVTIAYAIVGIPLTFLCVRNIGGLLSTIVTAIYRHAVVGMLLRWRLAKARMRRSRRISIIREIMNGGARRLSTQLSRHWLTLDHQLVRDEELRKSFRRLQKVRKKYGRHRNLRRVAVNPLNDDEEGKEYPVDDEELEKYLHGERPERAHLGGNDNGIDADESTSLMRSHRVHFEDKSSVVAPGVSVFAAGGGFSKKNPPLSANSGTPGATSEDTVTYMETSWLSSEVRETDIIDTDVEDNEFEHSSPRRKAFSCSDTADEGDSDFLEGRVRRRHTRRSWRSRRSALVTEIEAIPADKMKHFTQLDTLRRKTSLRRSQKGRRDKKEELRRSALLEEQERLRKLLLKAAHPAGGDLPESLQNPEPGDVQTDDVTHSVHEDVTDAASDCESLLSRNVRSSGSNQPDDVVSLPSSPKTHRKSFRRSKKKLMQSTSAAHLSAPCATSEHKEHRKSRRRRFRLVSSKSAMQLSSPTSAESKKTKRGKVRRHKSFNDALTSSDSGDRTEALKQETTPDLPRASVEEDEDPLSKAPDTSNVRVPAWVTLLIMTAYILGGAVMFTMWEEDWDFLVGSYFCFITLSTIGFGDFVPGTSLDSWAAQEKWIICCVYLLFGMAMQAMCFHLMQEEVRATFKGLAARVGLVTSSEIGEHESMEAVDYVLDSEDEEKSIK